MDRKNLGDRLHRLRKSMVPRITQTDLARRIGVHPSMISRIENGSYDGPIDKIALAFNALGSSMNVREDPASYMAHDVPLSPEGFMPVPDEISQVASHAVECTQLVPPAIEPGDIAILAPCKFVRPGFAYEVNSRIYLGELQGAQIVLVAPGEEPVAAASATGLVVGVVRIIGTERRYRVDPNGIRFILTS